MPVQVVLISGKMGSGKTTTQNMLVQAWNRKPSHKAIAVNFADILYEMADAVQTVGERYGIARKLPKDGPLLQLLGTEWGRNTIDREIWVTALKGKIKFLLAKEGLFAYDFPLFVVGDCRFQNEFSTMPEALRVRLEAPEDVRKERCSMWREKTNHESEVDLDQHATAGKFDLYFDTLTTGEIEIVEKIFQTLKANNWKESRK